MHKAKENANGTFSIGKSWPLDDLTVIESFTNSIPQNAQEQANKLRAGDTGFIVTIQKPYYWTAQTPKEKDYFIFSLIKVYRKYTGGRTPNLVGFSSAELGQLGSGSGAQGGPPSTGQSNQSARRPSDQNNVENSQRVASQGPVPAPPGQRRPSQDGSRARAQSRQRAPSQGPPSAREPRIPVLPPETSRDGQASQSREASSQGRPNHDQRPSPDRPPQQQRPSQGSQSQERQLHSTISHPTRAPPSQDRIHMPGSFPLNDSIHDPNQQPQLRNKRSQSPAISQQLSPRRPGPSDSSDSFRSGKNSLASHSSNERLRPHGSHPSSSLAPTTADDRPLTAVRNDPGPSPLSQDQGLPVQTPPLSFNPQPTESIQGQASPRGMQGMRNGHVRDHSASSRGSNRSARGPPSIHPSESTADPVFAEMKPITTAPQDTRVTAATFQEPKEPPRASIEDALPTPQPPPTTFPPTPPPETPPPEEVHRPGLGR